MNEDEKSGSIQITNSDNHNDDTEIITSNNTSNVNNDENINTASETDNTEKEYYPQNPIIFYFKRLFTVAVKTAKTPYFMLSAFVKAADYKVALGFIVIQSLLFASSLVSIFDSVNDLISNLTSGLGSFLYRFATFSLVRIFFVTLIASILLMFVFASIMHIFVSILMKHKTTYKQMLCIASSKCIAAIPFTIIAFIVSIFSPFVALFIGGLGTLLGYFFVVSALKGLDNVSENKVPYVAFLSFAVLALVTIAVIKIVLPLFLSSSLLSIKRGLY